MRRKIFLFIAMIFLMTSLVADGQAQEADSYGPRQEQRDMSNRAPRNFKSGQDGSQQNSGRLRDKMAGVIDQMKKQDPEAFEMIQASQRLERRAQELAIKFHSAESDEEKNIIEKKIHNVVSESMDLRFEIVGRQIEKMEEKLSALVQKQEERLKNKEELVGQYIEVLLEEPEDNP